MTMKTMTAEEFLMGVSPSAKLDEDFKKLKYSRHIGRFNQEKYSVTLNVFLFESMVSWEIYNTETTDLFYRRIKSKSRKYFLRRSKKILSEIGIDSDAIDYILKIACFTWFDVYERKEKLS